MRLFVWFLILGLLWGSGSAFQGSVEPMSSLTSLVRPVSCFTPLGTVPQAINLQASKCLGSKDAGVEKSNCAWREARVRLHRQSGERDARAYCTEDRERISCQLSNGMSFTLPAKGKHVISTASRRRVQMYRGALVRDAFAEPVSLRCRVHGAVGSKTKAKTLAL